MNHEALQKAAENAKLHQRKKKWHVAMACMASAVVLCTVYALLLPAIALEKNTCGQEEHVHSDACYTKVTATAVKKPVCTPELLNIHQHEDSCYDESGELICGYADFVVHEHTSACRDENGVLWCTLPEIEAHTHDANCYTTPESDGAQGHEHTPTCYTHQRGELTCTEHVHDESCYTQTTTQICGLAESEGHGHTDDCWVEGELTCGQEESEGHQHGEACFQTEQTCTCGYPDHAHTDDCYTWDEILTCGQTEEPAVQEPGEPQLKCEKPVVVLHEHSEEDCFQTDEDGVSHLICKELQVLEHQHSDACFQSVETAVDADALTCGQQEGDGAHTHGAECRDENGHLTCTIPESEGHKHTQRCYGTWDLTCGLEEHTHTDACPVIALIAALPTRQDVEARMAAFDEDETGRDDYLAKLRTQFLEAQSAYKALTKEEQAKVTNLDRLTDLEWLGMATLEEAPEALPTVEDGNGNSVAVETWTPVGNNNIAERLKTELHGVGSGYAIEEIAYYKISGLTGATATVTNSGLSAAEPGAKVFVYDLGADGAEVSGDCGATTTVEGNFDTFTFTPVSGQLRIYAFISARPATLEDMGIYLGTKVKDGYWTAMDGPDKDSANVKVDIQLDGKLTALPDHYPFISKVNPGEDFYPKEEAVKRAVGETNDVQCYKIHWVEVKDDGTYNFQTGMELGNGKDSIITLEYLNQDAQLKGIQGGRKLRVFSSLSEDGTNLEEISDSVQNVQLMEENYKGFTFRVTQKCPYVFVSEKVEKGYVEQVSVSSIVDGSAPFDSDNAPGNDSGESNGIVRSYDTIQYNLSVTFKARHNQVAEKSTKMYVDLTLEKSATAARFDTGKMTWLTGNYSIEYLDKYDNVVMVMAQDGKFYEAQEENGEVKRDESGFALPDKNRQIFLNGQLSGSQNGKDSYKVASGSVVKQRLVGWTMLTPNEGEASVLNSTKNFPLAVEVRNADNGEAFTPTFKVWLDGNEENYGPETEENGVLLPARPVNGNEVKPDTVTVSAGANFNLQLKKNGDMTYKNWFNFESGDVVDKTTCERLDTLANLDANHGKANPAEFVDEDGNSLDEDTKKEYANYRYGRITTYGIALQLYPNAEEENRNAKGLKGMSLPVGDITFDLNLWSEVMDGQSHPVEDNFTAILWEYNENIPAHDNYADTYRDPEFNGQEKILSDGSGLGNSGRRLYWAGEERSSYAKGGAPSNYKKHFDGCYYGGDWVLKGGIEQAHPNKVTGSGKDTTYQFTVSKYDFDFDDHKFPMQDAGNSGTVTEYAYARTFSAGCVQVLSVFPRVQKISQVNNDLHIEVKNLRLETRAGQELKPDPSDDTGFQHESYPKDDNRKADKIVLYAPGNLNKGNSFNGLYKGKEPQSVTEGFLGTDYWTTNSDCSTFAGDDIWIVSFGMILSGSDDRMRSMNLLQLFDSRALTVRDKPAVYQAWNQEFGDEPGDATFLFAMDPDYPDGYDTNDPKVLQYMNGVREEDLVYTKDMPDDEGMITANGMTGKCIGVLMEIRNCDLLGGKYQYMRIPVKVNGDDPDLVGKTVATVNTFRVWTQNQEDISWKDGVWDGNKNTLVGYNMPKNGTDENGVYSGELANKPNGSPSYYVKTEYENGQPKKGTHSSGVLGGNSLLILSYEAKVLIGIDDKKATDGGAYIYDQSVASDKVVHYRLRNIIAEVPDRFMGEGKNQTTQLTLQVDLDVDNKTGKDRLTVSNGSYRIKGYETEGGAEEKEFSISPDPNAPTVLWYKGEDDKMHKISVYAQMTDGGKGVKFVIDDAPVGVKLPDITFQANFGSTEVLENNDTLKTEVKISGQGDKRAYSEAKGNLDNITVGIVSLGGTGLNKSVDRKLIELNGPIQYTVTYSNRGKDTYSKVFFYDLLPASQEDIRGSNYQGKVLLRGFDMNTRGTGPQPTATVYYSTKTYSDIYDRVHKFGQTTSTTDATERTREIEEMLDDDSDKAFFKPLGTIENGIFKRNDNLPPEGSDDLKNLMNQIRGLYVKVEKLGAEQSVDLILKVWTDGNKAGDIYGNVGNSWIADSNTAPLMSNQVQTQVVSRRIAGVVWFDKNLNGVRDDGEPLLDGVTATLFKRNADTGKYEICTEDVTKDPIKTVTTVKGAYAFEKLAAGDYIVAFSSDKVDLSEFTGATTYQETGVNASRNNDGKPIADLTADGIDKTQYPYYIQHTAAKPSMELHSLDAMGSITLNNGVEEYLNQDLGLIVAGFELPKTGGTGTAGYVLLGVSLMAGALLFALLRRKKYTV